MALVGEFPSLFFFDINSRSSRLGFFNGYNFTIAENVAGDEDVAVDPEMLGKVFENMLAAEERGQSGTFYTPRGIVQFMSNEVLSRYLADESGMELKTVRKLIDYDPDLPDSEFNQLLTPPQARSLKKAIASVKVLDPAVGSGAFPLGMMQVILNVRQAIARREGMTVKRGSLIISQWKREIIANNLYGVDIKPEAIEIAKLRMWLSLVVDIPNIEDVEPLPNLDYKLMCGDSLISTIHGEVLIPDPTKTQQGMLAVTPIQLAIQPLLSLQQQYFNADSQQRLELRKQIIEAENNVFKVAVSDRLQYLQSKLKEIQRKINTLKKPTKKILKEREEIETKVTDLTKFVDEVATGKRSLNFFQYHLHFRDVFESQGGFDIVIGNPPYVRMEEIKDLKSALSQEYKSYTGRTDLYVYFYEQGFKLLRNKGYFAYISSNKLLRANYAQKIRQYLFHNSGIISIIDFGELPVFEAATLPMIFVAQKNNIEKQSVLFTQVKSLEAPYPDVSAIVKEQGQILPDIAIKEDNWTLTDSKTVIFISKLESAITTFHEYVNGEIYYGVKTGYNKAFIIEQKTRDRLINESPSCEKVIKKLIVGDDVRKWKINYKEKYLIYLPHGIDVSEYNSVIDYLKTYKERLENRATKQEWYELQQPQLQYSKSFNKSKIVYPIICKESRFTIDSEGYFINDKIFTIPSNDKYLLGILNSAYIWKYLKLNCSELLGQTIELRASYISKIPIPKATKTEKQQIEKLVQKCLDAKGVGIEEWEAEIDDRVAHLYGLTDEEMKIIKGE